MKLRSFELNLDRNDYATVIAPLIVELARLDDVRPKLLYARLAASVAVGLVVIYAYPESMLALFAAVMLFWLADTLVQSRFRLRIAGVGFDPSVHSRMTVTFDDEAIVETVPTRTRRWTWDSVRRVHFPSGYVVIELAGWDMIVLPDSAWSGPEEREKFLAELAERRPAAHFARAGQSRAEAEAQMFGVEPLLVARIALGCAAFLLVFETGGWIAGASPVAIVVASAAAAAATYWASGRAFTFLAERSPIAAKRAASALFALLAGLFALWFLQLI